MLAINALGETVHLSEHIDDSSLVVMMAAGARARWGRAFSGCLRPGRGANARLGSAAARGVGAGIRGARRNGS